MGAAVLLHSPLVGADDNGNVIGTVVRAGIPNLQTSMPSYPDLTTQEVEDLAAYIHYLRQLGRHKELTRVSAAAGDAAAGGTYFAANCASCHSVSGDLKGVASKYDMATLRLRLLGPPPPAEADRSGAADAGRRRHLTLLERYSDDDVRNLVAYSADRHAVTQHVPSSVPGVESGPCDFESTSRPRVPYSDRVGRLHARGAPRHDVVLELKGRALEGSGDLAGLGGNRSMQGQGGAIEPGVKSEKRALG